jgi:predicted Zn-dependent protease with MMP-like domain
MRTADFDQIVEQAFHRIPVRFRRRMNNVAVIVEDEPSPLRLQRGNASYASTLLGLYEGRPLAYRSVWESFQLPDRITIFQGPHERWRATARIWRVWSSKRCGTKSRITLG